MSLIKKLIFVVSFFVVTQLTTYSLSTAQCAMCSLNAENSTKNGNTQGNGLNDGVLFLLGMPFLIGGAVAILWYTKFRKKEEKAPML